MKRAENGKRGDRPPGQIGRDVVGDYGQAEDANFKPLIRRCDGLKVATREAPQTEFKGKAVRCLRRDVSMGHELVTDSGPNKVRPV